MDIEVRPERPGDRDAVWTVNRQAFGRDLEADLVNALRQSPAFLPVLSLVAVRDGEVVGHVLFTRVRLDGDANAGLLALGPIAVRPDVQGQGIGGTLIRAGLDAARARGARAVVLIGHPTYYPRFGFRPARPQGLETTFAVPDDVWMSLPLTPGALDGLRGTVRFDPAFDTV